MEWGLVVGCQWGEAWWGELVGVWLCGVDGGGAELARGSTRTREPAVASGGGVV